MLDPLFMVATKEGMANACRWQRGSGTCHPPGHLSLPRSGNNERRRQATAGGADGPRAHGAGDPAGPAGARRGRRRARHRRPRPLHERRGLARGGRLGRRRRRGRARGRRREEHQAAAPLQEPVHHPRQHPSPAARDPRAPRAAGACPLARAGVERLLRREALQGAVRHHLPRRLRRRQRPLQAPLQRDHGARRAGDRDLGLRRRAHSRALPGAARAAAHHPAGRRRRAVRSGGGVRGAASRRSPSAGA